MKRFLAGATALVLVTLAAQADAASGTATRAWQFKDAAPAALELDNLIGDVRVERGTAAGFYVSVVVTTEADTSAEAQALAEAVEFRSHDSGADSSFAVVLPAERFPRIYYHEVHQGWFAGRASVEYLGERRRLTGDRDEGQVVRVDILVRAPAGSKLAVRNIFGDSTADGISGEVSLEGTGGQLAARNGDGRARLDSGSGPVEVSAWSGEVVADTGSGAIRVRDCRCRIKADSGSGAVHVTGGEGELDADTGSGTVSAEDFKGSVRADTGSGAVRIVGSSGATEVAADTGSGSVSVSGDLSALQRLHLDTGSGGIEVEATAWPSMELVVDTGSGGVDIDVPGAEVSRDEDRHYVVRVGGGGFRGKIDTGSGSVRLRTAAAAAH